MSDPTESEFMTRRQVAEKFQVSPMTVRRWGIEGRMTTYKFRTNVRYKRVEVDALFKPVSAAEVEADGES